jgi:hypothetical protein
VLTAAPAVACQPAALPAPLRPPPRAGAAPTPASQRANLLLLQAAIDPAGILNWSPATDVCTQWEGITCNAQGLVQEITLMDKVGSALSLALHCCSGGGAAPVGCLAWLPAGDGAQSPPIGPRRLAAWPSDGRSQAVLYRLRSAAQRSAGAESAHPALACLHAALPSPCRRSTPRGCPPPPPPPILLQGLTGQLPLDEELWGSLNTLQNLNLFGNELRWGGARGTLGCIVVGQQNTPPSSAAC